MTGPNGGEHNGHIQADDEERGPLDVEHPWYLDYPWESLDQHPKDDHGRPNGTPPKYADSMRMRALCKALEDGLYAHDAAAAAGIGRSAFYDWKQRAPEPVRDAIADAETVCKRRLLKFVHAAMPTQWAAAMTLLERRWPEQWGRRDRVRHEVEGVIGIARFPAPVEMSMEAVMHAAALEEELSATDATLALPPHPPEDAA